MQYNASPIISRNDFSVNNTSSSSSPCANDETSKIKWKRFVHDRESRKETKKKESIAKVFGELNNTLNEIK